MPKIRKILQILQIHCEVYVGNVGNVVSVGVTFGNWSPANSRKANIESPFIWAAAAAMKFWRRRWRR